MRRRLSLLFALVAALSVLFSGIGVAGFAGLQRQSSAQAELADELEVISEILDPGGRGPRRAARLSALGGLESLDLVVVADNGAVSGLTEASVDLQIPDLSVADFALLKAEGFVSLSPEDVSDAEGALEADVAGLRIVDARLDQRVDGQLAVFGAKSVDLISGQLIRWFIFSVLVAVALAALLGTYIAKRIANPILNIQRATGAIAGGQLNTAVTPAGPPEVVDLANSVNTMAQRLQASREADRQFLLSVSHDLKTPLTVIKGYAEALSAGAVDNPAEVGHQIEKGADRLDAMVTDILDLAKLGSNRFQFSFSKFDLASAATDLSKGWSVLAQDSDRIFSFDSQGVLPVNADRQRVAQVLDNLVSNAVKFARSQVNVLVSAGNMGAEIRVVDDGPGISTQEQARIFEVYYSLSKDGDRTSSGNGLGLAVAKGLTVNMGGTISVESSTSSGTTMLFTLPIV